MTDPLESLKAVLCDPEGRVCIDGSDGDRRVIQEALAALASERAKQAEPVAFGHDGKPWPHTIDAKAWADEFCKRNTATDHGTMIGWFANAIEFARAHDAAPHATQQQAEPAFDWRFSHHYTAENIAAIVQDLKSVENGNESPLWKDRDHRTRAGILWRVISALSHDVPTAVQQQAEPANDPVTLARLFHATYERLAPEYGYETRPDTKDFDPESKNGRLMVRVCAEISNAVFCPTPAVQQQVERAYEDRSWDDATENAALVILHTVMQDNADGFQQWYKPEQWLGIHRAVAAYIVMHYKAAPPAAQQAEPVGEKRIANAIHYPACWDVAAYPELDDALAELFQAFRCQECAPPADDEAVKLLRKAKDYLDRWEARPSLQLAIDAYLEKVKK